MFEPKEVKFILKKYNLNYESLRFILDYCIINNVSYFTLEIAGIYLLKQMSEDEQKTILEFYFFKEFDIITLIELKNVIYVNKE